MACYSTLLIARFYVGGCPHCIDDATAADDVDGEGDHDDDDAVDDDDGEGDDAEVKYLERWDEVTNSIIGESTNTPSHIMIIMIIIKIIMVIMIIMIIPIRNVSES